MSYVIFFSIFSSLQASDSLSAGTALVIDSTHSSFLTLAQDSNVVDSSKLFTVNDTVSSPHYVSDFRTSENPDTLCDSSVNILKRDSLLAVESIRRSIYRPSTPDCFLTEIDAQALFTADPTSWNDVTALKKWIVAPRIGIASEMNRILYYGNTAPIDHLYFGTDLIFRNTSDPLTAHDAYFVNNYSSVSISGNRAIYFSPPSSSLISPEEVLFWENGVFGENIFSLRFTRPVARNTVLNVCTNYRSFNGTRFDHDGNDVYTLFSSITSDTTLLSHKGYNPLVNEFHSYATLSWTGKTSFFNSTISYADIINEVVRDQQSVNDYPVFAKLQHYPFNFHARYTTLLNARSYCIIEGTYATNRQRWASDFFDSTALSNTITIVSNEYTGALRTGFLPTTNDSLDCTITPRYLKIGVPDSIEHPTHNVRPEVRWKHLFIGDNFKGNLNITAGYDLFTFPNDVIHSLFWHTDLTAHFAAIKLNLYIENDRLHLLPTYDALENGSFIHDAYLRTGINLYRAWPYVSLHTGYQFYPDPNNEGIARTWINKMPPYQQPQSVFLVATDIGRLFGCALHSRILISDTRPIIKLQNQLSYHVLPELIHEALDLRMGIDYWSQRDPITFAGKSDWNRAILDINIAASIHIKSFRLLYKIDNLLNRDFSYIPGYYSPGITFRWGFNWFIQR